MEEFSSSHPDLYEKYSITVRELESEQMPTIQIMPHSFTKCIKRKASLGKRCSAMVLVVGVPHLLGQHGQIQRRELGCVWDYLWVPS